MTKFIILRCVLFLKQKRGYPCYSTCRATPICHFIRHGGRSAFQQHNPFFSLPEFVDMKMTTIFFYFNQQVCFGWGEISIVFYVCIWNLIWRSGCVKFVLNWNTLFLKRSLSCFSYRITLQYKHSYGILLRKRLKLKQVRDKIEIVKAGSR